MRTTSSASRCARAALCLAAASLAACASATGTSAVASPVHGGSGAAFDRSSDRLDQTEIQAAPAPVQKALDLVRQLRPDYLRTDVSPRYALGTTGGTTETPVLYVDGNNWGSLDALVTIPANRVGEIRRLRTPEARVRYGPTVQGPVIEVRLLRRR